MFELIEKMAPNAVIKVIGVGGGGGNAVSHMVHANVEGVDFVCANTDSQALKHSARSSRCSSARTSRRDSVPAQIPRSAARLRSRIASASSSS